MNSNSGLVAAAKSKGWQHWSAHRPHYLQQSPGNLNLNLGGLFQPHLHNEPNQAHRSIHCWLSYWEIRSHPQWETFFSTPSKQRDDRPSTAAAARGRLSVQEALQEPWHTRHTEQTACLLLLPVITKMRKAHLTISDRTKTAWNGIRGGLG